MNNLSFIKSVYLNFEKFTDELFDETTIQDDEFMKLFFIECHKRLNGVSGIRVFENGYATQANIEYSEPDNSSDMTKKFENTTEDIPYDTENVNILSDLPENDNSISCRPKGLPNFQTQALKIEVDEKKILKLLNLAITEGYDEMPAYVQ